MSYLDQVSIAISPYVGRAQKAIDFYKNNMDLATKDGSLFLALAHGPEKGWVNDTPELPNLNTMELDDVFKFIRYNKMYFVKSDIDGKINVGNLTWTKVSYGNNEEEYFRNVRNAGARWLYVEFNTNEDTDITVADNTVRQIGIYSDLKLNESADPSKTVFLPEHIAKITDTMDNRYFDGVLTLIQNKSTYQATSFSTYSFIIEF